MMKKALTVLPLLLSVALTAGAEETLSAGYRYWFDNVQEAAVDGPLTGSASQEISFTADASALPEGMHILTCLFRNGEGAWSAPFLSAFYKGELRTDDPISALEYWIDADCKNIKSVKGAPGNNTFTVQTGSLTEGMHMLAIRGVTQSGAYGAPSVWAFYKTSPEATDPVSAVEYWLDAEFAGRKSVAATAAGATFQVDAAALKEGLHTLTYRLRSAQGRYGNPGMWMFYKTTPTVRATGITWYRYWWNDREELAVTEKVDPANPFLLERELTVPDYAMGGYGGRNLTARLCMVFGDDAGNVSAVTYADVRVADVNAPVTTITADREVASNYVNLSWSGLDEELRDYNVYVSEDNQPFLLWLPNTTSTSATFRGDKGKTYRFTVRGRDTSDNMEPLDETKCVTVEFK